MIWLDWRAVFVNIVVVVVVVNMRSSQICRCWSWLSRSRSTIFVVVDRRYIWRAGARARARSRTKCVRFVLGRKYAVPVVPHRRWNVLVFKAYRFSVHRHLPITQDEDIKLNFPSVLLFWWHNFTNIIFVKLIIWTKKCLFVNCWQIIKKR